jgi:hypothetical protein
MTCQKILQAQNKPYPRTCEECGLGPCKQQELLKEVLSKQWVCSNCMEWLGIKESYLLGTIEHKKCFVCEKITNPKDLFYVDTINIPQRATPSSLSKINAEQKAVIRDLTDACRSALDRYASYGLEGPDKKKLIEAVKKAEELDE